MGCGRWLKTVIMREGGKLNANESKEAFANRFTLLVHYQFEPFSAV